MAADIMLYKATCVPVGEDQSAHLELTREIVRRFNYLYNREVFPEPQAVFSKAKVLPGIDGVVKCQNPIGIPFLSALGRRKECGNVYV